MAILFLNFCKDDVENDEEELSYISQSEFIGRLSGKWHVYRCNHYYTDQPSLVTLIFEDNEVKYFTEEGSGVYSKDDTLLCMLPEIEKLQFWGIESNDTNLLLEADDLCGGHRNFVIEYSNYRWICPIDNETGNTYRSQYISADLRLVNSDTMITLNEFLLDSLHQSFDFRLDEGENSWLFRLNRDEGYF
jgi:hypothetical protein